MKKSILTTAISLAIAGSAFAVEREPSFEEGDIDLLAQVRNQCIVRLNDNIQKNSVKSVAQSFANKSSVALKNVYSHSIKGFTIKMSCAAAQKAFAKDTRIKSFELDRIVSISKGRPGGGGGGQTASYGTARVGGPVDGTGYTAWVIDTGIDLDHPDLNVDASRGFTAI